MVKMGIGEKIGNLSDAEELHPDRERALSLIWEKAEYLSAKYGIEKEEIFEEMEKREHSIPLSALSFGTAPLEAIVSYLKDARGFSIKEIAKTLGRSYKTIWATYSNAKKMPLLKQKLEQKRHPYASKAHSEKSGKMLENEIIRENPKKGNMAGAELLIPISAFSNSNLGIFESAVKFLKEECGMRYGEIARATGRNPRTVWTAYKKAKEKE